MKVDIQLSPAVETWVTLRDGVRVAEDVGFDSAWVFDHFAGSMLGGSTMLECFTLLGALAATTERIRLGSMVVNVNNRPPGLLAAATATAQSISAGRLTLGLGAGAAPASRWSAEHEALGIALGATIEERHRRLVATLDELDRLWSPSRPEELSTFAMPDPRPRIVLGVNSEALAQVAARRCQGINIRGDHPSLERIVDAANRARAAGAGSDVDLGPWETSVWAMWDPALLDRGNPEMRRWEAFGVTRLVMVFLTPLDREVLRQAADRVRRLVA